MFNLFRGLWLYRYFVLSSIRNEFIIRFARSKLGGLWMVLNPLAQVTIYAVILSSVFAAKIPSIQNKHAYAIYLMTGLLAWSLFAEIISRCTNLFVDQGNLIRKMNFPRITLPSIVVGACCLNNLLLFVCMVVIFLLFGYVPNITLVWLLPLSIVTIALATGIGLILGVFNVFVRDIGQIVPIALQIGFWFTPIAYPINIIPEHYRHWLNLNPMYTIVRAYHSVLIFGKNPNPIDIFSIFIIALLLMFISLFIFRRASADMVDNL